MKKGISLFALFIACSMFIGCGNDAPEDYQGPKLNKSLVESLINHYSKFTSDKEGISINPCGEYIAIPGKEFMENGNVRPSGFILLDGNGDSISGGSEISYRSIGTFSNGLAPVYNWKKWGLINTKGKYVLPLEYDYIGPWMQGNCIIIKDKKIGLLNNKNETVVPFGNYNLLICWENGLTAAVKDDHVGLLNLEGKEITPFQYENAIYHDGLVFLKKNDMWGAVDKSLKEIIPFEYNRLVIDDENSNLGKMAMMYKGELRFFFDGNGKAQPNPSPCLNIATSNTPDGKKGVVDEDGNIVVPFEYKWITEKDMGHFYEARKESGEHDYFNTKGVKILTRNADQERAFNIYKTGDFFAFPDDGVHYHDTYGLYRYDTGEQIIPHQYGKFLYTLNFIQAKKSSDNNDQGRDIFDTNGSKIYSIKADVSQGTFLNGYYFIEKDGKYLRAVFVDYNGNHLFDIVESIGDYKKMVFEEVRSNVAISHDKLIESISKT